MKLNSTSYKPAGVSGTQRLVLIYVAVIAAVICWTISNPIPGTAHTSPIFNRIASKVRFLGDQSTTQPGQTSVQVGQPDAKLTPELATAVKIKQQEADRLTRSESAAQRFQELSEKLSEAEVIPVIVRVRATYIPENELKGATATQAQRLLIGRAQGKLISELSGYDPASIKQYKYIPFMAVRVNSTGLESLRTSSSVLDVNEDVAVPPDLAQSVPLIGGTNAWASGFTGAGQTVAILDTGVDKNHPFLANKVVSEACFSTNAANQSVNSVCPGGVSSSTAPNSGLPCGAAGNSCDHGTHVAGIVAGKGTSSSGVAKDATLIAVQVFSQVNSSSVCSGKASCVVAYDSDLISGLERVYQLRDSFSIAAANMSLGGGRYMSNCDNADEAMKAVIDLLRGAGIATVVASGNSGYSDSISAPACISTAISVGSTTDYPNQADTISSYSNSSSFLNLLAPGEAITSSVPGGGYATWGGTSMATPHVAGAWAIAKQKLPTASVTQVLNALTNSGVMITDPRNKVQKPRIQIDAALGLLGGSDQPPTVPATPTGLLATVVSESQINLSWTDASGDETGFRIRRRAGSTGSWAVIGTVAQNVTTFQNTGLTPSTAYNYSVVAFNSSGESGSSNEVTATTIGTIPAAPSSLQASVASPSQIQLSWIDNSLNETGFTVERRLGLVGNWIQVASLAANSISFVDSGLSPLTAYSYRVYAFNPVGVSPASNLASATTPDAGDGGGTGRATPPSNLQGSAQTESSILLTWSDRSGNESGFQIQRRTGINGTWSTIATLGANVTSYLNSDLIPGTSYYYNVTAYNASGVSIPTNEVSVSTPVGDVILLNSGLAEKGSLNRTQSLAYKINVPLGVSQLAVSTSGTGNVDLYLRQGNQASLSAYTCRSMSTSSNEQCYFSFPAPGDWYILIYAYNLGINTYGLTATYQSGSPNDLPAWPTKLTATATIQGKIGLNWVDNSTNESLFRIRRKSAGEGLWSDIATVGQNVTSYEDSSATKGVEYYYSVSAFNTAGLSAPSNEANIVLSDGDPLPPTSPTKLQATVASPTQINLSWTDTSSNETGFRIQRKTGSVWLDLTSLARNVTAYQHTGLTPGQTWIYRVIAFNPTGDSGPSNEVSVTTTTAPVSPGNLKALAISSTQINLTWSDNSSNETGFRIWRKTSTDVNWVELGTVGENKISYQNTGLNPGVTYNYTVTAYNSAGESQGSNESAATTPGVVSIIPSAPVNLRATVVSFSQINLSWSDTSANESGFRVRRRADGETSWTVLGTVAQNVTSYQNVDLSPGVSYSYSVIAFNNSGESPASNEANATTPYVNSISLTSNKATSGVVNKSRTMNYWITVPVGATQLVVQTTGSGNADLYVRYGVQPSLTLSDCRSVQSTSVETCNIPMPKPGDWQIMVYGNNSGFSIFSLTATYKTGTPATLQSRQTGER